MTTLFDDSALASLYASHDSYLAEVERATESAVAMGFLLPADATLILTEAANSNIGAS